MRSGPAMSLLRRPLAGLLVSALLLAASGESRAASGVFPRDPGSSLELRRVQIAANSVGEELRLSYQYEIEGVEGDYALAIPLASNRLATSFAPDTLALDALQTKSTPRWVMYSTGCGSGNLEISQEGEEILATGMERALIPMQGDLQASVRLTAAEQTLDELEDSGYRIEPADRAALLANSEPSSNSEPSLLLGEVRPTDVRSQSVPAIGVKLAGAEMPRLDLGFLSAGMTSDLLVTLLVQSSEPYGLEGVEVEATPPGDSKTSAFFNDSAGELASAYEAWIFGRLGAVATGAPSALLEYSGPGTVAGTILSRYRIYLPAGRSSAVAISLTAAPRRPRYRLRAIVSAGGFAPAHGGGGWEWLLAGIIMIWLMLGLTRRRLRPCLALLGLLLAGCPSVSVLQGTRTVPAGEQELTVALGPARDIRHDLNAEAPATVQSPSPRTAMPEVMLRHGWTDASDVGLRLFLGGIKADVRTRLLNEADHGISLVAGLGLSAFAHPSPAWVCATNFEAPAVEDGCYSSLFFGGMLDFPITISHSLGPHELYAGLRGAFTLIYGETTYENEAFPTHTISKTIAQGMAGLFFGASVQGRGYRVTPELQIMSSVGRGGKLVWFPVAGVGVTWPF